MLGPNGAGKSTTFNITTAMIPRSGGLVELKGVNIDEDLTGVYFDLGICPQFNCVWEDLTVLECLYVFAKIKGIPRSDLFECLGWIMKTLQLQEHSRKRTKFLSGGTKRKLCVGMALIGSPDLLFMDEPSTGLDPMAKRHLWNSLSNMAQKKGASCILTTHSMEEAEALCNKIGIIVNGRMVCFGPLLYLKNKYGSGYKVTLIKFKSGDELTETIKEIFPEAIKSKDDAALNETYTISHEKFVFSSSFRALDELKKNRVIKDFSIYNTTLEQLFINFSKKQQNLEFLSQTNEAWQQE